MLKDLVVKLELVLRGSHSSRAAGLAGGNDVEGCVCATSLQAGPLLYYNIYIYTYLNYIREVEL